MKFKLDENIGQRGRQILLDAGHDVSTVDEQSLTGATDADLIEASRAEERCLVTLDLDFANPLTFAPRRYPGIAVLRLPENSSHEHASGISENTNHSGARSTNESKHPAKPATSCALMFSTF